MKAILIDDEPLSLKYLAGLCMQLPDLDIQGQFQYAPEALDFLKLHPVDLVLTDIEMPGLNGIDAITAIRETNPDTGVIFITGYEEYAIKAFQLNAVSYLMKPCSLEELNSAVIRAGKLLPTPHGKVLIKTFGSFSVIINGAPLHFSNSKARELLALLVDRNGSVVTMEQAIDCLWEDRPYDEMVKRLYRKAVSYLHQLCDEHNLDFFVSNRGSCHIILTHIECDYFLMLTANRQATLSYHGEYMSEYDWAEETNGKLHHLAEQYRVRLRKESGSTLG